MIMIILIPLFCAMLSFGYAVYSAWAGLPKWIIWLNAFACVVNVCVFAANCATLNKPQNHTLGYQSELHSQIHISKSES
jgi:hypothetical protein